MMCGARSLSMGARFLTFFKSLKSFLHTCFNPPPAATQSNSATTQSDRPNDGISDWKRTGKVVYIVGFGGFSASVTLIINTSSSAATHRALYVAYIIVVCLGITTSIDLSVFSIMFNRSPSVGWVQKKLIYFTLCFFSFFHNLHCRSPDIGIAMILVKIIMIFILLYLFKGSRSKHVTDSEAPENEHVTDPELPENVPI